MEVNYYQDAALPENRVDVYYREQDTEITGLMEFLEAERVIVGRKGPERQAHFSAGGLLSGDCRPALFCVSGS